MDRQNLIGLLIALLLGAIPVAHADTLVIENIDQSADALSVRPNRGMSMDTVEAKWGQPDARQAAIGEPPITRWEYPNFIVYFEYSNVIHSVRKP